MKNILKKILSFINGLIPKNKNKIVLESSPDFSDNAKAIYDYLLKKGKRDYTFVWSVYNYERYKKLETKKLKFITKKKKIRYFYHVFTSKYVFFGNRGVIGTNIKKQIVVNLTHGLPFKCSKGLMQKDEDFTYVLSSSDNVSPAMASEFYSKVSKCLVTGLPRNDVLFLENNEVSSITKGFSKFILWLPTYKKHKDLNTSVTKNYNPVPLFNNDELESLNKVLKDKNILLILKFHPAQDLSTLNSSSLSNIFLWKNDELVDRNIDLYKLMSKSDALITDYSSVFADYLLLDRPIAYIVDDYKEFKDNRGFCFDDIEKLTPGDKIKNKDEFITFVDKISNNIDSYKEDRKRVRDFYHKYQDGTSTKVFVDYFDL